jgi:hypothetical protein
MKKKLANRVESNRRDECAYQLNVSSKQYDVPTTTTCSGVVTFDSEIIKSRKVRWRVPADGLLLYCRNFCRKFHSHGHSYETSAGLCSRCSYERKKEASEKRQRDDDPIQEQRAKRRRSAQSYPFSRNENRRASSEPASEEVSDRRRWCVRRTDELSAFFLLARNSQEAKLKIKCAKIKFFKF